MLKPYLNNFDLMNTHWTLHPNIGLLKKRIFKDVQWKLETGKHTDFHSFLDFKRNRWYYILTNIILLVLLTSI